MVGMHMREDNIGFPRFDGEFSQSCSHYLQTYRSVLAGIDKKIPVITFDEISVGGLEGAVGNGDFQPVESGQYLFSRGYILFHGSFYSFTISTSSAARL
jgi:hypothetical protein